MRVAPGWTLGHIIPAWFSPMSGVNQMRGRCRRTNGAIHLPKGGRQATASKCSSQAWRPFTQATRPLQLSQAVCMGGYISRRRHGDANAERKKRAAEQQKENEGLWGGQVVKDPEPKPKPPKFLGGRKKWPMPRASREIPRGHALRIGRPESWGLKKALWEGQGAKQA